MVGRVGGSQEVGETEVYLFGRSEWVVGVRQRSLAERVDEQLAGWRTVAGLPGQLAAIDDDRTWNRQEGQELD